MLSLHEVSFKTTTAISTPLHQMVTVVLDLVIVQILSSVEGGGESNGLLPKQFAILYSIFGDLKKMITSAMYVPAELKISISMKPEETEVLIEIGVDSRSQGNFPLLTGFQDPVVEELKCSVRWKWKCNMN